MKKLSIVTFLIFCSLIVNAQIVDTTTIYEGCKPLPGNIGMSSQKYADVCPEFPGGLKAFYKYLAHNLKFPKGQEEISEKVWVQMIVEKNGRITNTHVVHGGGTNEMNNEALRVVKKSPKWNPAIFKGKPVRSYYYIPISFIISD